jgi:hypothetical protein
VGIADFSRLLDFKKRSENWERLNPFYTMPELIEFKTERLYLR